MKANQLVPGIYRVHAKIGTRDLFEGIWPLPNGVMLNSYLVQGSEKIALIDLVKDWEGALDEITAQMTELGVKSQDIDYLILNHMEPDHTGSLAKWKQENPQLEIICTKKAVPLVKEFYGIDEGVRTVNQGDTLDLGGKVLEFFETPNIHWPETMMTYEQSSGILFSCDGFGSFGQYEHCFDDELTAAEWELLIPETERYFSNIVSTFSSFVLRGIEKFKDVKINMVAPSHGVVWRSQPEKIINLYHEMALGSNNPKRPELTLIYSSMYGNTAALVQSIIDTAEQEGVVLHVHEVPQEHVSFVLTSAWRSSGLILGMPTYEYKMFPPMYHVLDILDRSHVKQRKVIRFGSYGWSGGAQKQFEPFVEALNWDCLGVVEYQGAPKPDDYTKIVELVTQLAQQVKAEANS